MCMIVRKTSRGSGGRDADTYKVALGQKTILKTMAYFTLHTATLNSPGLLAADKKDVALGRGTVRSARGPGTGLSLAHPVPPWPRLRNGSGCCEWWL